MSGDRLVSLADAPRSALPGDRTGNCRQTPPLYNSQGVAQDRAICSATILNLPDIDSFVEVATGLDAAPQCYDLAEIIRKLERATTVCQGSPDPTFSRTITAALRLAESLRKLGPNSNSSLTLLLNNTAWFFDITCNQKNAMDDNPETIKCVEAFRRELLRLLEITRQMRFGRTHRHGLSHPDEQEALYDCNVAMEPVLVMLGVAPRAPSCQQSENTSAKIARVEAVIIRSITDYAQLASSVLNVIPQPPNLANEVYNSLQSSMAGPSAPGGMASDSELLYNSPTGSGYEIKLQAARSGKYPQRVVNPKGVSERTLTTAEAIRKREAEFQCHICNNSHTSKQNLENHIASRHLQLKRFPCPFPDCTAKYGHARGVNRHLDSKHPGFRQASSRGGPSRTSQGT